MANLSDSGENAVPVRLGRQGQLVLPVSLRQSLGFEPGDQLVARQESGCLIVEKLVLEPQDAIKRRLHARYGHLPRDRSLATELIAERRQEAQQDTVD